MRGISLTIPALTHQCWKRPRLIPASSDLRGSVDASGKTVFSTRIIYNPDLDFIGNFKGSKMPVDKQYQFASMDALKGSPEKTVAGLKAAISAVVHELDSELGQPADVPSTAKVN